MANFAFLSPSAYHDALAVQTLMKCQVRLASPCYQSQAKCSGAFLVYWYALMFLGLQPLLVDKAPLARGSTLPLSAAATGYA